MLAEAVEEARRDVEEEVSTADRDRADRRKEALLLVSYNLAKLNLHITGSRRILNDLRTLRRLLLAERGSAMPSDNEVAASGGLIFRPNQPLRKYTCIRWVCLDCYFRLPPLDLVHGFYIRTRYCEIPIWWCFSTLFPLTPIVGKRTICCRYQQIQNNTQYRCFVGGPVC